MLGPLCGLVCCRLCVGVISRCRPAVAGRLGLTSVGKVIRSAHARESARAPIFGVTMASASHTRSSMTVEVDQPLSELCGALCSVQIEVGGLVAARGQHRSSSS